MTEWVFVCVFIHNDIMIAKPELQSPFGLADMHFETKLVRLGANVILSCPFTNFDHLEWFKGIETLNEQNTSKILFENVSPADEGNHIDIHLNFIYLVFL